MLEFVNDVRLIKHRFTSNCIFSFLSDFSSHFGLWPAVCAAAHSYNAAANRRPICGRLGTDPEPTGSGLNQIQY